MSVCPRIGCTALLREDLQFRAEMETYNLPQRRFLCHAGHSVTVNVPPPALRLHIGAPVHLPGMATGSLRVCPVCEDEFRGTKRQKFCSSVCTRVADTQRNLERLRLGKKMTGEELRVVRAMPRPWNSWKRNISSSLMGRT